MANLVDQSILNKSRTDKFILAMNTPKCLQDTSTNSERSTHQKSFKTVIPDSMQYSIYGSIVPSVNIPSIEVPQYGQTVKVSSHNRNAYDDVSVSFTVDNEFNNYDGRKVSKSRPPTFPVNSEEKNPPHLMEDYQTDMTLFGINEYNKNAIKFTYTKSFPVSLGDITYSYRDVSEIESSFTFSFTQLLVELL